MHDPLIGTEFGHFKIERLIAEGGMGMIYQATHSVIGRKAAIKILSQKYSSDKSMIKRLHLEAQAVNRIGHPNIIDIFDFGQTADSREYFVMEYLPGQSLAQLLEELGRLPWSLIAPIMGQILDALAAAHDLGIIHRDIKPENILVVEQDQGGVLVKILDFGIAKSIGLGPEGERLTRAGSVMGTPEYIAPEQIRGREVDGRADLYAVGVILFEMIMGKRPFESNQVIELLMAHIKNPIPSMENIPVELGIPVVVPSVAQKAMAKEPEQRYPDARSFSRALGLQTTSVIPSEGTRPMPELYWEGQTREENRPVLPSNITLPSPALSTSGLIRAPSTARPTIPSKVFIAGSQAIRRSVLLVVAGVIVAVLGLVLYLALRPSPATRAAIEKETIKEKVPPVVKPPPPKEIPLQSLVDQVWRVLRSCLSTPHPEARRLCVQGIGELHDTESFSLVSSALKEDPDRNVRSAAALTLATLSDPAAVSVLREARGSSDESMRAWLDEALMRMGEAEGQQALKKALQSPNKEVRFQVALSLAESGHREAIPVLEEVMRQAATLERQTVIAVLGALAKLGHKESYESLGKALHQTDPVLKLGAAEAMSRLGNEEAVAALKQFLTVENLPIRLVAAKVLASLGDYAGLESLRGGLRSSDENIRMLAAEGLGSVVDKAVFGPLSEALHDESWPVKAAAAESLARIFSSMPTELVRRSQDWIKTALANRDWSVRYAAVGVTSEMDPELAINLLGWAFRDKDPRVRMAAVASLGELRSKKVVPLLKVALADTSTEVRIHAAKALGGIDDKEAKDALHMAVRDRSPEVAATAAGSLLALGDSSYLEKLQQAALSPNPDIRHSAITALGRWRDPQSQEVLLGALKDKAPKVRFAAAYQLAQRGNNTGLPELRKALGRGTEEERQALKAMTALGVPPKTELTKLADSPNPEGRKMAMESALLLDSETAISLLNRGVGDPQPQVRLAAARSLTLLGGKHPRGLGLLKILTKDPDPTVRAQAEIGLAKLNRDRIPSLDKGSVRPVAPPPPTPPPTPPPPPATPTEGNAAALSFEDPDKLQLYKYHLAQAAISTHRVRYTEALAHLKKAQRFSDQPTVLYEFGYVNLKLALQQRTLSPQKVATYLNSAKGFFQQYLRRAPQGQQAEQARRGLEDVARLLNDAR